MSNCAVHAATVMEAGPEGILLRVERERDEEESGGCRSCAMRGLCRGRSDGTFTVAAPPDSGLAAGDRVSVRYSEANPALASVIMFAPALIGLFAGGFAVGRLTDGGDGMFLAGCLAGLAVGLGVTFLVNRYAASLKPRVRIVGKL